MEVAVIVSGSALSYAAALLPYEQIGADYGPFIALTLMASLLCGICAVAVSVIKQNAVRIGLFFTFFMGCGLLPLFEINRGSSIHDIQAFFLVIGLIAGMTLLITFPLTLHRTIEARNNKRDD